MYRISTAAAALFVIAAGIIQAAGLDYLNLLGAKPDILFIIVIFFSLCCDSGQAVKIACVAGLLKDITSSSVFGSYAISFMAFAFLLSRLQSRFYKEKASTQIMLGFFSYMLMSILVLLVNFLSCKRFIFYYALLDIIIKSSIYTAAISPFIFFITSRIFKVRLAQNL